VPFFRCKSAKKNAISYDWPTCFASNSNTMMANSIGQLSLKKDVTPSFFDRPPPRLAVNTSMKYGMSKETPFAKSWTELHPGTKANGRRYVASLQNQMMNKE
jgi:hypothetical protein